MFIDDGHCRYIPVWWTWTISSAMPGLCRTPFTYPIQTTFAFFPIIWLVLILFISWIWAFPVSAKRCSHTYYACSPICIPFRIRFGHSCSGSPSPFSLTRVPTVVSMFLFIYFKLVAESDVALLLLYASALSPEIYAYLCYEPYLKLCDLF